MALSISVTEDRTSPVKKIQWTVASTAADGTATLATTYPYRGIVTNCVTNPGSTAPTDNYDITITDADGTDILQGAGADRDTANTETCVPAATSTAYGVLTLNVSNAGDGKQTVVTLFILTPYEGVASPPWSRA